VEEKEVDNFYSELRAAMAAQNDDLIKKGRVKVKGKKRGRGCLLLHQRLV
jgi:hypothetical protein